jgi:ubiquinone/menaquinone biosynthesis C-methylase UbiE
MTSLFRRKIWYISRQHNKEIWDENADKFILRSINSKNKYIRDILKYLSESCDLVIDIGCGIGDYLKCIKCQNKLVTGVDYSFKALKLGVTKNGILNTVQGDFNHLPYKSNQAKMVMSLGAFEHCVDGPEAAIKESSRVLQKGGILYFTVPYFNTIRKLKTNRKQELDCPESAAFYQYGFSKEELLFIVSHCGLEIMKCFYYDSDVGVLSEMPAWLKSKTIFRKIIIILNLFRFIPRIVSAHMIGIACIKK